MNVHVWKKQMKKNNVIFSRGHTTLNQLLIVIRENKDKRWIIIHTSIIHKDSELIEIQTRLRDEGLDVTIVHDRN